MLNNVAIIGRLVDDPKIYNGENGLSVSNFTIAVNYGKDENGDSLADFFDVKVFDSKAIEFTHKGDLVGVSGYLKQDTWQTKEGDTRHKVIIVARSLELLTPKAPEEEAPAPAPQKPVAKPAYRK